MCLTGVDYFSTLGYQPGIAFVAAGALSPFATLVLVLLTLFGALPMYRRVAEESPHGDGSISMLERLLDRWKAKLFVLVLLGFVATSFIITITLSAADATAHIIENPFVEHHLSFLNHRIIVTLVLIALLGLVFLKGFKEAIGIAVGIVAIYLSLNLVIIGYGLYEIFVLAPETFFSWQTLVWRHPDVGGSAFALILASLVVFPKLALGLSGFETGVVVMPLVKGGADLKKRDVESIHVSRIGNVPMSETAEEHLEGRIRNGKKLLTGAALIMSLMLIGSSVVTSMLIPPEQFLEGGKANGRALSYLAHDHLGEIFGTLYDLSTILILWFAGSSAMAGLLNIVPRYLPRYGMAPFWATATRPLVLVFTAISFLVTILFRADVDSQGGAYATGVLTLMASAAVAVTISARKRGQRIWLGYMIISLVFFYTTFMNVLWQPEGLQIAVLFVVAIVFTSFISRVMRSTEIRIDSIEFDESAKAMLSDLAEGEIRIVANRRESGDVDEYRFKEHEKRTDNHIPSHDPVLFFEVELGDASEFTGKLLVRGFNVGGYKILRAESPAVPNAIAGLLLYLRDDTGKTPHMYFGWSEGNPISYLIRYLLFGEGDTAPVTREILRQAEPDPEKRPSVHVGG
ncbi:MAG: APC family permease [Acidobacteria bacterium]|nr:MAG: APC family permease [Acidobacteriota bacterium]REK03085.1 MAG: APC family permease [Acidobacteriota bacterium]REK15433.1 MAG: APC family permease [Acidobacteriota bacterium]REK45784.1 MAG: APC family permease [Acidobacteriota bacterium]